VTPISSILNSPNNEAASVSNPISMNGDHEAIIESKQLSIKSSRHSRTSYDEGKTNDIGVEAVDEAPAINQNNKVTPAQASAGRDTKQFKI
jgi:hypothetical protein